MDGMVNGGIEGWSDGDSEERVGGIEGWINGEMDRVGKMEGLRE